MASSQQLRNERSKYYVFREQVNVLATKTLESYNQYYSVHKKLKEVYLINGSTGDKGVLSKDYAAIKTKYDILISNTLPAINSKIDRLTAQIRAAEQQEMEEAKRAEEELARRKAQQLLERI